MQKEVVVVSGARTAIGAFGGSLRDIPVVELGATVIREALKRAGLRPKSGEELLNYGPDVLKSDGVIELEKKHYDYDSSLRPVQVDEVVMGNVLLEGHSPLLLHQPEQDAKKNRNRSAFFTAHALLGLW